MTRRSGKNPEDIDGFATSRGRRKSAHFFNAAGRFRPAFSLKIALLLSPKSQFRLHITTIPAGEASNAWGSAFHGKCQHLAAAGKNRLRTEWTWSILPGNVNN